MSQPETVSTFESVGRGRSVLLQLRLCRRQLPGDYRIGKSTGLVRAIAEGLVSRMPATAEPNAGAAGQTEGLALRINDFEVAFYADRSVVIDRNFRGRHFFSCLLASMPIVPPCDKAKRRAPRSERGARNRQ